MWRERLSSKLQIPLVNADRMMMSILPEVGRGAALPDWARELRDNDESWMVVAQRGVQAFVGQAMRAGVPFAMETVFSHWKRKTDGSFESKIDNILDLQRAGYFVLLFFVGLESAGLSILRVQTRVAQHGHDVEKRKLVARFPRTQKAIRAALSLADAAILTDNSREPQQAFTVCRVQLGDRVVYDMRSHGEVPGPILRWLGVVAP
jgi:predicted ABC-type ATPase